MTSKDADLSGDAVAGAPVSMPWSMVALWLALVALASMVALHLAYINGDGFFYLAHGRYFLAHGLPDLDPFSDTSIRTPLIVHMLLPMLAFAALEPHIGVAGLVVVTALFGAGVLALFLAPARRSLVAMVVGAAVLALLLRVDHEFFEVRGQIYAYAPFAVWLALCRRARALAPRALPSPQLLALAFVTAALWANTHPSFLLAVALPLTLLLVERRPHRALALLAFLALASSLASPYGPRLLVDALALVFDETTQRIDHMRSPPVSLAWCALVTAIAGLAVARIS
ncbi:MAG TPA: hypothetical protein VGO62_07025, partial [Myxococcota bacterium]